MSSEFYNTIKQAKHFAGFMVSDGLVSRLIKRNEAKDYWLFKDRLFSPKTENLASHAFILDSSKGCIYESHFKTGGITKVDLDQWKLDNKGAFICIYEHKFNQEYIDKCLAAKIPYAPLNILQMVRESNFNWLLGSLGDKDHPGQICSEFVANASSSNLFCKEIGLEPHNIKPSMIQMVFYRLLEKHVKADTNIKFIYISLTL